MYDCILALSERMPYKYSHTGQVPKPMGNARPSSSPYSMYKAEDGSYVFAAPADKFWRRIAKAIGRKELGTDPSSRR